MATPIQDTPNQTPPFTTTPPRDPAPSGPSGLRKMAAPVRASLVFRLLLLAALPAAGWLATSVLPEVELGDSARGGAARPWGSAEVCSLTPACCAPPERVCRLRRPQA